ncbi:hypothetical protein ASE91_13665 [Sphingomonas sp. Leaf62]|nr:hypothetical protein ASE91_13665 [Sphingomonas sp. Leaf62]
MIGEFSAFLRYGLAADSVAEVELADEVDMQLRYLTLARRRFAHLMTVTIDVDDDVRHARLPALILQPLVENAIKHGVAMTSASVLLSIRAFRSDANMLVVRIEDDAWSGSPSDEPATLIGLGIGLCNVTERLLARFGNAGRLVARTLQRGGFRSEFTVPLVSS